MMVARQAGVQETHNDMYCSTMAPPPTPYGEFYPDTAAGHYYVPAHAQDLCPAHHQVCTLHGDYGPVTVPMVSTNSSPPIAMPVQVPPGHVVQQIVDESGTLRHVILSPQHPMVPLPHTPQHYGGGPGNGNTAPSFYGQNMSGPFPPSAHYHLGPHVSPHPPHSPPPPPALQPFHKDERTQRQYNKLKRKLELKQRDAPTTGSSATAHLSPRHEVNGGSSRRHGAKGVGSVGTSEDGDESGSAQDEEDDVNLLTEILSSVLAPQVSELSSRSALLTWRVPVRPAELAAGELSEAALRYDVLLSDKGKEGRYKSIYTGTSLSCRIQDLRPGQQYSVCVQAHVADVQGSASDPATFSTPPCEPDQPLPPKLISRSRTGLQLRWGAPMDNGSYVQHYILEYDEGRGGEAPFVELSKCRGKQFHLTKLLPSTHYRFRLAAVNDCGRSLFSEVVSYVTSGAPPAQPAAPVLVEATAHGLRLSWAKRPADEDVTLQMLDEHTGYGFMNVYFGRDAHYECRDLRRRTEYRFRLRAQNQDSMSPWSEEAAFQTLAERPGRPSKPHVRGRIHAHQFRVRWDAPHDDGGARVTAYMAELSTGSGFEPVYSGHEPEASCDKLTPGTTYQVRVCCANEAGPSPYSDLCTVTTEPVVPSPCCHLRCHGKPRATALTLRWGEPDCNGGSPVTDYEVKMLHNQQRNGDQNLKNGESHQSRRNSDISNHKNEKSHSRSPDNSSSSEDGRVVYRGRDTECTLTDLLPGQQYTFTVRALNRVGHGPWFEPLVIQSAAAPPDVPSAPRITAKSPSQVLVDWVEPQCNGAVVTEYRLEMAGGVLEQQQQDGGHFSVVHQGAATFYEMRGLTPATPYIFRVSAVNSAGASPFSAVGATVTPASTPNVMAVPRYESTPKEVTLQWSEPVCNGSDILHYNVEFGEKFISTEGAVTQYTVGDLQPDTGYKVRVQAVNGVGTGSFSPSLKVYTLPLPPTAPKLECIALGHNYLKLKWGDGKNTDFTQYYVEMENPRTRDFQCVYQGTNLIYKVNKLQELTVYRFRISAANDAGQGDFGDVHEFKTCTAPPTGLKPPKVVEVTQRTCCVEWNPCKAPSGDPVVYCLQFSRLRDQDFKQAYRGNDVKHTLTDLEPGVEYNVRVCPVRQSAGGDLAGPFSGTLSFQTTPPELTAVRHTNPVTGSPVRTRRTQSFTAWMLGLMHHDKKPMTDKQWAILILLVFTLVSIYIAVVVQQFINV